MNGSILLIKLDLELINFIGSLLPSRRDTVSAYATPASLLCSLMPSYNCKSNVAGTLIDVKLVQPQNALLSILVRCFGRVIKVMLMQYMNAAYLEPIGISFSYFRNS